MTGAKSKGTPEDFLTLWRNEPWPDSLVEACVQQQEITDEMARFLAYQAGERISKGLAVPPALQNWFNRYVVIYGGYVPKCLPDRQTHDRGGVAALHEVFGLSQAEAIRRVADVSGREVKSVETNVHRTPYQEKYL